MIKYIFFLISLSLGISSCECSYSYGIYVENATGEDLEVVFKSSSSDVEERISFSKGEKKYILQHVEHAPEGDCTGAIAEHCEFVAEYVQGIIRDSIQSKTKWCDPKISFEKTDIQEGEFLIKFTEEDFL